MVALLQKARRKALMLSDIKDWIFVGWWMYRQRWPLKIEVPKHAFCKYEPVEQQYIITIYNVIFRARKPVLRRNECLSLKDSSERFLSVDSDDPKPMVSGDYQAVDSMKFDTNVVKEDFKNSSLSRRGIKGRIIIGKCKSAYFEIQQVVTIADHGVSR